jgi:hypothetical protein
MHKLNETNPTLNELSSINCTISFIDGGQSLILIDGYGND